MAEMSKKEHPSGNDEFDAWWPKIRDEGPSHDDWSMDDYEYPPIDLPMLDAFAAGQEAERLAIVKKLKDFREERFQLGTAFGDALSQLLAEVVGRGFKP